MSENLKIWGAIEYKQDYSDAYWGTPLVSTAFSGPNATTGIVSGTYVSNFNGTNLGPVTIDSRTLTTNYNVLDNYVEAKELWLRSGFELDISDNLTLKSQVYGYGAQRNWMNSEVAAFNSPRGYGRPRTHFYVAHDQTSGRQHHRPDLEYQYLRHGQSAGDHGRGQQSGFQPAGCGELPGETRSRWSILAPGLYGLLTIAKPVGLYQQPVAVV